MPDTPPASGQQPRFDPITTSLDGRLRDLASLLHGWNGHGSCKPMDAALEACAAVQFVPMNNGGMQVEWHVEGHDIEIVFDSYGEPRAVSWERIGD